jgi:hypothetical protein
MQEMFSSVSANDLPNADKHIPTFSISEANHINQQFSNTASSAYFSLKGAACNISLLLNK